ncbi:UNVERIFIED_CONTAM: putative B3 domain-containing protein [Sesamum radiatum]|uniref:B3 domain-containing protein n=1 Tax=Sesamum radiatum TaxID=300843 RepID=A0AAW2W5Y2_SESRA
MVIVPTDEEAILPITPLRHDNKGKRKMSHFFDETEPIETGVSTHLTLHFAGVPTFKNTKTAVCKNPNRALSSSLMSSTQLFHALFDEGKGKIPQFFDFFASESEGKLAVDMTTVPTDETEVSTDLSLLHFASPAKKTAVVSPRYSPPVPGDVVNLPALPEDRWEIKKVLKKSDVDESSRLLLSEVDVQEYILPRVMGNGRALDEGEGVEVAVWDIDKGSEHVLVLQKWKTGSFVLKKKWMSEFVRRRGLEKNDEIGLRWDEGNSRLEFTVFRKNG